MDKIDRMVKDGAGDVCVWVCVCMRVSTFT